MKAIKLWKKQEKRIVKLLYKKGFLTDFKLTELYWNEFKPAKRPKRKRPSGFKFTRYFPEVHFGTVDYYGEGDEHSLVDCILERLFWENATSDPEEAGPYPESSFNYKGRLWFIKYLSDLPNKCNDNRVNKLLRITYD